MNSEHTQAEQSGSPDASHVCAWRTKRQESTLEHVSQRKALAEHFEAMHDILEQMGHRPFGRLELRMPGYAFDSQVIFRWDRPRPSWEATRS